MELAMGLLDQVLGGVTGSQSTSSTSPLVKALMLLLAAKAFTSYTQSRSAAPQTTPGQRDTSQNSDTIQSGILKGAPSLQGLGTLLERLTHGGLGGPVKSWVGSGENQHVAPDQLHMALGPEVVDQLEQQTGMPRDQLLGELSRVLPQVVDKLTPHGRMPTHEEAQRW
jgi:uncharacterized protein YidB (DUF937 family)